MDLGGVLPTRSLALLSPPRPPPPRAPAPRSDATPLRHRPCIPRTRAPSTTSASGSTPAGRNSALAPARSRSLRPPRKVWTKSSSAALTAGCTDSGRSAPKAPSKVSVGERPQGWATTQPKAGRDTASTSRRPMRPVPAPSPGPALVCWTTGTSPAARPWTSPTHHCTCFWRGPGRKPGGATSMERPRARRRRKATTPTMITSGTTATAHREPTATKVNRASTITHSRGARGDPGAVRGTASGTSSTGRRGCGDGHEPGPALPGAQPAQAGRPGRGRLPRPGKVVGWEGRAPCSWGSPRPGERAP